jgi:hypothetical protein
VRFFSDKIGRIRSSTAAAAPPVIEDRFIAEPLSVFQPSLDPIDPSSYRPIANLRFVSKIVEKVVDARLSNHASKHNQLPVFHSSCRLFHSTETAVICVADSMLKAMDQGHVGALMLLDRIQPHSTL